MFKNFNFGIYSTNLERVLLVDTELWPLMHTARLLSSKLSLCVIAYNDSLLIDNSNCITWTCNNFSLIKMDKQSPRLSIVNNSLEPVNVVNNHELDLIRYYKFSKFILKIVKSARLTDFLLNSSDHHFYNNLLDIKEELVKVHDDSGISEGFLNKIDRILYLENDEDTVLNLIKELLEDKNSYAPTWLTNYRNTFFSVLENYEKNNI